MDMILFEVFLKSIDLIPQQILQHHYLYYRLMSLYYLILWNQVDILQKHFKKDHVHWRLWTRLYGIAGIVLAVFQNPRWASTLENAI